MSSHKYGLATDWIVGMTVVLANGTIAHTSATENPGLFWALRGSGSNYGVVASYEFNTFAAPSQVTYFSMPAKWNTTTAPGYMNAVENYTKAATSTTSKECSLAMWQGSKPLSSLCKTRSPVLRSSRPSTRLG
jgi:FAD/FMN-containing dehydrogenase